MLIDTDVIIWYMRGNEKAFDVLENRSNFTVSVITYMELVQGMRNKDELVFLRKAFKNWGTRIVFINEEISSKAMFYVEQHYLSHSMEIADALIAATSVAQGEPLLTGNDKHYKVVKEIDIRIFRP